MLSTKGVVGSAVVVAVLALAGTWLVLREVLALLMPVWVFIDNVGR